MKRKTKEVAEKPEIDRDRLVDIFGSGFHAGWEAHKEYERESEMSRKVAECKKKLKEYMGENE